MESPEGGDTSHIFCIATCGALKTILHPITPGFTGGHRCIDPSDLAFIRYTKTIFSIMGEITFVLTSCGRLDLLEITLDSFFKFNIQQILIVEKQ